MADNSTKGRWRFEVKDSQLYIFSDGGTPEFPYFATIAVVNNWDKKECEANAHILAASKNMYEALKDLLAQFVSAIEEPYQKDKEICERANKALAKAEGK